MRVFHLGGACSRALRGERHHAEEEQRPDRRAHGAPRFFLSSYVVTAVTRSSDNEPQNYADCDGSGNGILSSRGDGAQSSATIGSSSSIESEEDVSVFRILLLILHLLK